MVILKSRGQGPKKIENYRKNLSRTFNKNLDIVRLSPSSGLTNPPPRPPPSGIAGKSDSQETFQQLFFLGGGEGSRIKGGLTILKKVRKKASVVS